MTNQIFKDYSAYFLLQSQYENDKMANIHTILFKILPLIIFLKKS